MSRPVVEFFFDCSSPGTYLAFHNLREMQRELAFEIAYKPLLVGGVFNAVNRDVYDRRENTPAVKLEWLQKSTQDWARLAGLTIKWPPPVLPVNSVKAMRGVIVAQRAGRVEDMAKATFEAFWLHGEDISKDDVLEHICERIGFNRNDYFAGLADETVKAELRNNTEELIARGGFGSPTMFVNGGDMQWGNDHVPLVRHAVQQILSGQAEDAGR